MGYKWPESIFTYYISYVLNWNKTIKKKILKELEMCIYHFLFIVTCKAEIETTLLSIYVSFRNPERTYLHLCHHQELTINPLPPAQASLPHSQFRKEYN